MTMIHTVKDYEKLSEKYNKMLEERNSLIDDLPWYKAKVNRLERHNKDLRLQSDTYFEQWQGVKKELQDYEDEADDKIKKLERENEKLQGRLDEFLEHDYDDQKLYKENRNLLSEISQHIGNKPSSSTYKYFRAKLDGIGIKVGE